MSLSSPATKNPWSTFQEDIFSWVNNPVEHLMIEAGAGCGKTTTIVELYRRLVEAGKGTSIPTVLFMAFNKKIAVELESRFVPAMTMNSFGFRVVLRNLPGVKLEVNKLRYLCKDLNIDSKKFGLAQRCVELMKAYLYPRTSNGASVQALIEERGLSEDKVDMDLCNRIAAVFDASLTDKFTVDFADQIAYPYYWNMSIPKHDYVIIDECQDLSPSKLMLVSQAVGKKIVTVGDPFQAIYGFCGADSESMSTIKTQFNPVVKELPVTYRCGKRIVKEAHDKGVAPKNYQAGPDNHEGEVTSLTMKAFEDEVKPKDFVLCRVSAPLVKGCFSLIKKGVRAQIVGKDVGERLLRLVDKIMKQSTAGLIGANEIGAFCEQYTDYRRNELHNLRKADKDAAADRLEDELDCLFVFTEGLRSIADMKLKISNMFDDSINPNAVIFSTIHKAKGLEAERVFCLPYKCKPPKDEKQKQEEKNLLYVQITRAKTYLAWVTQ